jgi:hypothetical protein
MLKQMVEVKMPLKQMVISEEWEIHRDDDQISSFVRETVLNDVWWGKVEFILKITTPIHDMIRLADTDLPYVTPYFSERNKTLQINYLNK